MQLDPQSPLNFPAPSATQWGEDIYGLWMVFDVNDVRCVFRWIEPGEFLMGSPMDEKDRDEDELQHSVVLTRGFWLAETTVTQALWSAVMDGGTPSRFKGNDRPVEQVSWNEAQKFIGRCGIQTDGEVLRLPTEAEWEYACRAGSKEAFSFGDWKSLNRDRVNYSGKWQEIDTDGETKPVKSYEPNAWGLYEMHGNVWEWCEDWFGEYDVKVTVDPEGPEGGEGRVMRGGSWFSSGRNCRSAIRLRFRPGYRDDRTGFRLSLGQELKPAREPD